MNSGRTAIDPAINYIVARFRGEAASDAGLADPHTREEAYAVQDGVIERIGPAAGWKIGRAPGHDDPYCAPIPNARVHSSGARLRLKPDAPGIRVEAELALILGRDIPPASGPWTREDCLTAIRSIAPAIEILETRLESEKAADTLWKLADLQGTGGAVLGPEITWDNQDMSRVDLMIRLPGRPPEARNRDHPFGDALEMLTWQINHAAEHRGGLRAGDFLITGSYCGILDIAQPGLCEFTFAGMGAVGIELTPA